MARIESVADTSVISVNNATALLDLNGYSETVNAVSVANAKVRTCVPVSVIPGETTGSSSERPTCKLLELVRLMQRAGAMIIDYAITQASPLGTIRNYIASSQITLTSGESNRAIGYAEAADALGLSGDQTGTFLNQTVDSTAVLVRYTLMGDANLDGVVGFADLVKVAKNYGKIGSTWSSGDFDRDGNTNFGDFVAVAQNYGSGLSFERCSRHNGRF